jgi:hypothetical protein
MKTHTDISLIVRSMRFSLETREGEQTLATTRDIADASTKFLGRLNLAGFTTEAG